MRQPESASRACLRMGWRFENQLDTAACVVKAKLRGIKRVWNNKIDKSVPHRAASRSPDNGKPHHLCLSSNSAENLFGRMKQPIWH